MVRRKHSSKRQASNRKRQVFTAAIFNIQRISHIKVEAIIQDGCDMMALTELGGRPEETWELDIKYPNRVFCSELTDSSDPAAGAAVILSKRMAKHVMNFERVGTRIVWVRLQGMHYNLIFMAVYIPQKARAAPNQAQTIQELESTCRILRKRYPNDQLLIGMDANCKLARNQDKLTGHACIHYKNNAGGERLVELMTNIDLMAERRDRDGATIDTQDSKQRSKRRRKYYQGQSRDRGLNAVPCARHRSWFNSVDASVKRDGQGGAEGGQGGVSQAGGKVMS